MTELAQTIALCGTGILIAFWARCTVVEVFAALQPPPMNEDRLDELESRVRKHDTEIKSMRIGR